MIIGVTGNALNDEVLSFLEAGADSVFTKPFKRENIPLLLDYIDRHGCSSNPSFKIFEKGNSLQKTASYNNLE